ncbi:MAG: hypothetical protein N2654_03410 [Deltaproteobacteria bacterium]|nr:hypothetical protein [Deltaproteobacteria bacterium]
MAAKRPNGATVDSSHIERSRVVDLVGYASTSKAFAAQLIVALNQGILPKEIAKAITLEMSVKDAGYFFEEARKETAYNVMTEILSNSNGQTQGEIIGRYRYKASLLFGYVSNQAEKLANDSGIFEEARKNAAHILLDHCMNYPGYTERERIDALDKVVTLANSCQDAGSLAVSLLLYAGTNQHLASYLQSGKFWNLNPELITEIVREAMKRGKLESLIGNEARRRDIARLIINSGDTELMNLLLDNLQLFLDAYSRSYIADKAVKSLKAPSIYSLQFVDPVQESLKRGVLRGLYSQKRGRLSIPVEAQKVADEIVEK